MDISPSSGTVDKGGLATFVATATYQSGPPDTIGFAFVSGPPSASVTFSLLEGCTPTCSTFVTIDTAAIAPGTHTITIEGVGSHSVPATYMLTVTDPSAAAMVNGPPITQTNDGSTNTGFNLAGATNSSTAITGTGDLASVALDYESLATTIPTAWKSKANLPVAVGGAGPDDIAAITSVGTDTIYVLGGGTRFWKYTISTNAWATMTPTPASIIWGVALTSVGTDTIYAFRGGSTTFWKYTISTDTWSTMAPTLVGVGSGASLVSVGTDTIYAFRGSGTEFYKYTISTDTWSTMAPTLGTVGNGGSLAAIDSNTLYATRGYGTTTFWKYTISTDTWVAVAPTPGTVANGGSLAAIDSNTLYATRGYGTTTFWKYTISTNTWSVATASPTSFYSGGRITAVGPTRIFGMPGYGTAAFYEYSRYYSSGTYTSGVLDTGQASDFTTLGWTTSQPGAATSIIFDVQSGTPGTGCADATWNAWDIGVATVTTANATGSATIPSADGRCVRYRAVLAGNTTQTPLLNDVTVNYLIPGTFNFTVATSDSSGGRVMGGSPLVVTPGVTATLTYGTSAPNSITFSADDTTADGDPSDLPPGATVSFSTPSCDITCTSEFTIFTTTGTTPLGDYVFPITASIVVDAQNTITKEATYAFSVTEPFDFSMAWSTTSSGTVTQGENIPVDFTAAKIAGSDSEAVTFDYSTAAQGISVTFLPFRVCAPSTTCPGTLTADIRTAFTGSPSDVIAGGPYRITIIGTSASSISHSIDFYLTVDAGFNFLMALDDTSNAIYAGDTAPMLPTLTTTHVSPGSLGTVSYAITNPDPANITIIPPSTLTGHTFTTAGEAFSHPPLIISVSPSFIPSVPTTYSIIITGTSGTGFARYATYVLTVYPLFDFTMQFSSPSTTNFNADADPQDFDSGTVYQGESVPQAISVTFNSPLPQVVNLTSSIDIAGSNIALPSSSQCTAQYCTVGFPIITGDTTPENTYIITVTGTGGGKTHTVTYTTQVLIPPFDYNMRGWAFSDGIGWISFSVKNCDTNWNKKMDSDDFIKTLAHEAAPAQCPPLDTIMPNYGTHLNSSTYEFSGFAWSEHIGWITFDRSIATDSEASPPPDNNTNSYLARLNNNIIEGWARARSCPDTRCDTDSTWGWIKMSGNALDGSPYDVRSIGSDLAGFAWGGHVLGWISFSSKNCDDNGLLATACGGNGTALFNGHVPFDPNNPYSHPNEYKVYALITLPNKPPICVQDSTTDLESNFLDRCVAPFAPIFTCTYQDNEGDPLVQYTLKICNSTDATCATPVDVLNFTYCDADNNGFTDAGTNCGGNNTTTPIPSNAIVLTGPQPDPESNTDPIPVSYTYSGTALQYGNTYYFTVEVRDPAHLN